MIAAQSFFKGLKVGKTKGGQVKIIKYLFLPLWLGEYVADRVTRYLFAHLGR